MFCFVYFLTFHFEITDLQDVAKRIQRGPVYPSPSFPSGYILHNCSTRSNQETGVSSMHMYNSVSFCHMGRFVQASLDSRSKTIPSLQRPWSCCPFIVTPTPLHLLPPLLTPVATNILHLYNCVILATLYKRHYTTCDLFHSA